MARMKHIERYSHTFFIMFHALTNAIVTLQNAILFVCCIRLLFLFDLADCSIIVKEDKEDDFGEVIILLLFLFLSYEAKNNIVTTIVVVTTIKRNAIMEMSLNVLAPLLGTGTSICSIGF